MRPLQDVPCGRLPLVVTAKYGEEEEKEVTLEYAWLVVRLMRKRRKPISLRTLQIRDAMQDHIVCLCARGARRKVRHFFCALKLITTLTRGNKLGTVVTSCEEGNKTIITEVLRQFTAADNARALVTIGVEAKHRVARVIVLPTFDLATCVHDRNDVLICRHGTTPRGLVGASLRAGGLGGDL